MSVNMKPSRASRGIKLTKPQPLKRNNVIISDKPSTNETQCAVTCSAAKCAKAELPKLPEMTNNVQTTIDRKDNTTVAVINVGCRASRKLGLSKPAPLKSSRIGKTDSSAEPVVTSDLQPSNQNRETKNSVPHTNDSKARQFRADPVDSTLSLNGETRPEGLQSQVSQDSGLGDMGLYSRQSSVPDSVDEDTSKQVNDFDSISADIYSRKVSVKQTNLDYRSDMPDVLIEERDKKSCKNSSRDHSTPAKSAIHKREEDVEFSKNLVGAEKDFKLSPVQNLSICVPNNHKKVLLSPAHDFSIQIQNRSVYNTPVKKTFNINTYHVVEDWEKVIDKDTTPKAGMSVLESARTHVNRKHSQEQVYASETNSTKECTSDDDDEENDECNETVFEVTDRSLDIEVNRNNNNSFGDHFNIGYRDQIDSLSMSMAYRDTSLNSSFTRSTDEDKQSISTCDEGFNEQQYAWELLEDLTDRVKNLSLEKVNDDVINVEDSATENELFGMIPEIHPVEDSISYREYPADIDAIEAELDFLRNELDDAQSENDEWETGVEEALLKENNNTLFDWKNNVSENAIIKCDNLSQNNRFLNGYVVCVRMPLSPTSLQDEIWNVEEKLPSGLYTAKGRRSMFRNHRLCYLEEREMIPVKRIQYTIEELLQIGSSQASRKQPESWAYMAVLFPNVCLQEVTDYLDTTTYKEERCYVVEHMLVQKDNKNIGSRINPGRQSKQDQGFTGISGRNITNNSGFGRPNLTVPHIRQGFGSTGKSMQKSNPANEFETNILENQSLKKDSHSSSEVDKQQTMNLNVVGFRPHSVNLDTKCDISVRNNTGGLKMFAAATSSITPASHSRGVTRPVSDPAGVILSRGQLQQKDRLREICSSDRRNTDGVYFNENLPEKCPW